MRRTYVDLMPFSIGIMESFTLFPTCETIVRASLLFIEKHIAKKLNSEPLAHAVRLFIYIIQLQSSIKISQVKSNFHSILEISFMYDKILSLQLINV